MLTIAVFAVVLFAGLAVGMTGIGGLLLVPALSVLGDMPLTRAIPASTLAFLFTGIAATVQLQRRQRAERLLGGAASATPAASLLGLQLASLLGAALGAWSLHWLPTGGVHLALAALSLASGLQTLLTRAPADATRNGIGAAAQWVIGLAVGLGSAWSGTGGPILLLPVLMWRRNSTRSAIAMAQAVQLPIALAATAVNLAAGQLDLVLGLKLGVLLLAGWAAGIWVAGRMSTARLRQALGWLLVGVGLWYGLHTLQA